MANIVIDPPYPETEQLLQWKHDNMEFLDDLVLAKPYISNKQHVALTAVENTTLSQIRRSTKQGEFQCSATFQIHISEPMKLSFSRCPKCHSSNSTPQRKRGFYCFKCEILVPVESRSMLNVILKDLTGSVKCVAYDKVVSELLGCNAEEAAKKTDQEIIEYCTARNEMIANQPMVFNLKKKSVDSSKFQNDGYIISSAQPVKSGPGVFSGPQTPQKTNFHIAPNTGLTPELHQMTTRSKKEIATSAARKDLSLSFKTKNEESSVAELRDESATKIAPSKKTKTMSHNTASQSEDPSLKDR